MTKNHACVSIYVIGDLCVSNERQLELELLTRTAAKQQSPMKLLSLLLSSIFYLLSSVHAAAAPPATESSQGKLPAADGVSTQSEGGGQALKPNVIILITDDQGYGDLACHGNPVLKTPSLDKLHTESIRFTNFHVSPFCTPTRAALMTGRHPARTGAFRTASGRSTLKSTELTMAEYFAKAGYATGMIGKWHLGDNAPSRPMDQGFQHVVWHKAGGIGQAADYWGNNQFDDTYERNGTYEKFQGYATDIWFTEAQHFVTQNKEKPFFLYLSLNAPHSPYKVPKKWSAPYKEKVTWKGGAEFYGMITNLDHNLGELRQKLSELNIADNTIFIFMTDNGSSNGTARMVLEEGAYRGFSAGMKGMKSTVWEGGHRVPLFIHWPGGNLTGGQDRPQLSAHLDILPTLADLCGFALDESIPRDGNSFTKALQSAEAEAPRDHYITQLHGGPRFVSQPVPYLSSCVAQGDWRLIEGENLYHLKDDPGQLRNIADKHPEVVAELRAIYDKHWQSISSEMTPASYDLGNPAENPTHLCSQDWFLPQGNPPWNFGEINQLKKITGPWNVNVVKAGTYKFTLRQFPEVADKPLVAIKAKLRIAGIEKEAAVKQGAKEAIFTLELPAGKTTLTTWLTNDKGETGGAYFTEVELLNAAAPSAPTSSTPGRADWLDQDKFGLFIH